MILTILNKHLDPFCLFYFLKNPLEDYASHEIDIWVWTLCAKLLACGTVWRKLDTIHVWKSDELISVAKECEH